MDLAPVAFSSDGSSSKFDRNVDIQPTCSFKTAEEIESEYEMQRTFTFIRSGGFRRVALQFPDALLMDSVPICKRITLETGAKAFIMADTSYGSCCVDEVTAAHSSADCIIHYGEACLSQPASPIPVQFVFGMDGLNVNDFVQQLSGVSTAVDEVVVVLYDLQLLHLADVIMTGVKLALPDTPRIYESKPVVPSSVYAQSMSEKCLESGSITSAQICLGRQIVPPDFYENNNSNFTTLFLTSASSTNSSPLLSLWLLANPNCNRLVTYDSVARTVSEELPTTTRALRKRLFLAEKLKDSRTIGIICGTVGVKDHKLAVDHVKALCQKNGKKCYTFSVGKLNVAKVSNFAQEIDMFVLVSCPYGVLLDYSDYYRPIASVFEVEVAFNPNMKWFGDSGFLSSFADLDLHSEETTGDVAAVTDMSLISGQVRTLGGEQAEVGDSEDNARDSQMQLYNTAGGYFSERSWQGLEEDFGQLPPAVKAVEGRKGVAAEYHSEPIHRQ